MDVELSEFDLRYSSLRICERGRESRLIASLAATGQHAPVIVLRAMPPAVSGSYVLLDGYKRERCAKRLGWAALSALCWDLEELDALIFCGLLRGSEKESALEQGWLLRELQERFGLGLEELGRRFGRSPSWVSRRLGLIKELPGQIQEGVRQGQIVPHGAMKYLVPLARANRKDCVRLYDGISAHGLSSRQMGRLYNAYISGNDRTRELILKDPVLYLKVEEEAEIPPQKKRTPAEELIADLRVLGGVSRRADHRLRGGVGTSLSRDQRDISRRLMTRAQADFDGLIMTWRKEGGDAGRERAQGDPQTEGSGERDPRDREGAEGLPEGGARHSAEGDACRARDLEGGEGGAL